MSALDGWFDVLRTGTWRDMRGVEATFSAGDLDGIVAATRAADPAPVVVGHPDTDAPAWAWIEDVRRVGDRLQARLRDLHPAFRSAVEEGRYAGRSVALMPDNDLGVRIRHLGFLGGVPPAVEGLAPTRFSAPAEAVRTYELAAATPVRWGIEAVGDILRSLREWIVERDGVERADRVVPEYRLERVTEAGRDDEPVPGFAGAAPAPAPAPPPPSASDPPPASSPEDTDMSGTPGAGASASETDLAARAAALDAREAVLAAAEASRAASEAVAPHVEAGRVLPAERAGLEALFASLPPDAGEGARELVFASPDGSAEVRTPPRKLLLDFVAALPRRVEYRELAGDAPPAPETGFDPRAAGQDARAAREYVRLAAERGETVTITEAVDVVRRQREQEGT